VRRYQTAIDSVSQGVCLFDGEARLILCNRRYAEIYRLAPGQLRPGATLREIAERCVAVGTSPMETDDFLSWRARVNSSIKPSDWTFALRDGRTVQVHHQPMPDGGWFPRTKDITELHDDSAAANERISLQTLIDWVPDNLWVKDVESRFVIANKATAIRMGFAGPEDLIGRTDLELCLPEKARHYFSDEQRVVQSGQPMIDKEEVAALGERHGFRRRKCRSATTKTRSSVSSNRN
jgi:PAS domain-containing protein